MIKKVRLIVEDNIKRKVFSCVTDHNLTMTVHVKGHVKTCCTKRARIAQVATDADF